MSVAMDIRWWMTVHGDAEPIGSGAEHCQRAKKSIVDRREFFITDGWRILTLELA